MFTNFFKHWKTSLAGLFGAALTLISHGVNWKSALSASALAALGLVAKDGDKQ